MKKLVNRTALVTLVVGLIATGCSTTASGPSDEALIDALLGQWEQGVLEKDVAKLMATYSEDFAHDGYDYAAEDKAGLKAYLEGAIAQGNFDDVELSLDNAEIGIEGDAASVYPIDYAIWEGAITIKLTLAKEEGGWLITDMDLIGL